MQIDLILQNHVPCEIQTMVYVDIGNMESGGEVDGSYWLLFN
jgi:hypothetical protein